MIDNLFEHGWLEETHDAVRIYDVPDNARAVVWGRYSLSILLVDTDVSDTTTMLLQRCSHDLGLLTNLPDTYFTFHASWHDTCAVISWRQSSNAVVMCVVDCIKETAWLRQEGTDLAIIPTWKNAAAVIHKLDSEALEAWHLNTEKLLTGACVPDTDVILWASRKKVRIACREGNVVDLLVMTSVTELRRNGVRVAPVDCALCRSSEEVGRVGCGGDWGTWSLNLLLPLNLHHLVTNLELSYCAITSTNKKVTICQ